jgi:hypothetical protein
MKLRIRALPIFLIIAAAFFCCSRGNRFPKRTVEDGVEIIQNGPEPFVVRGGKTSASLSEEFRIDLEDPSITALGLSDAAMADMDSQGRLYLFRRMPGDGPLIFVFDERGTFRGSFGRRGQGPGEIEFPFYLGISSRDEILVRDSSTQKILFFDTDGSLLRTVAMPQSLPVVGRTGISLLENGNYLIQYFRIRESSEIRIITIGVFDDRFQKIKDLVEFDLPGSPEKISNPFIPIPVVGHSRNAIFLGYEKKGTDISVFDLNGSLKRIIRKPYPSVKIPETFKEELLARMPADHPLRRNLKLPRNFPAFQFIFSDDFGHIIVATCKKDTASGQNMCDIFTPEGVYIQRLALGYFDVLKWIWEGQPGDVVVKKGRALCVRDKESGFREIIVYSLRWS